jgi:hypothetical protein
MARLTPAELDQLIRSQRRLWITTGVALLVVVAALIILVPAGVPVPVGGGIGAVIGLLTLIPHRRLLSELGLSRQEANEILAVERARRSGVAALPPEARAAREILRSRVYLVVGLVLSVVLVAAVTYFASKAGETVEEDAPADPWFYISGFAGLGTLCLAPVFLILARSHKNDATAILQHASSDPAAGQP